MDTKRAAVAFLGLGILVTVLLVGLGRSGTPARQTTPASPTSTSITITARIPAEASRVTPKGLTLTARAADKVKAIGAAEHLQPLLRVRVVGRDAAFQYDAYFEDDAGPLDDVFVSNGVKIAVDPLSLQYLDGTVVDYVEGDGAATTGFKFDNPNARK